MLLDDKIEAINDLSNKIKTLPEKAKELLIEIVKEDNKKGIFEDFNREQLFRSLDSNLNPLGFYTQFTIDKKRREGKFIKPEIILFDDGDLWENIVSDVVDDTLIVKNEDPDRGKLRNVIGRFGEAIFGLSVPQQNEYIELSLRPRLIQKVMEYLKG